MDKLRQKAEALARDPSSWFAGYKHGEGGKFGTFGPLRGKAKDFVIAANYAVVLRLLDERDKLRAENAALKGKMGIEDLKKKTKKSLEDRK